MSKLMKNAVQLWNCQILIYHLYNFRRRILDGHAFLSSKSDQDWVLKYLLKRFLSIFMGFTTCLIEWSDL